MGSFSLFLMVLVGLVWFSAGMIVWTTLHLYLSRRPEVIETEMAGAAPILAEDLRKAA